MIYGYMIEKNNSLEKFESAIKFADSIIESENAYSFLLESNIIYESFDFKTFKTKVITTIKRFFQKIKEAFERFLMNINYLKNAQLPKKQSEDLLYCLNLMKPRTLDGIDQLIKLFSTDVDKIKSMKSSEDNRFYPDEFDRGGRNFNRFEKKALENQRNDGFNNFINAVLGGDDKSDFEFEFGKTIKDVDESMEALEKSAEYDRIKNSSYDDEKEIVAVPMNSIVKDMKDSTKSLSEITHQLGQLERAVDSVKESSTQFFSKVAEMATSLCNKVIKYYNERITLLNIFFKSAKASLEAIKNNIKASKLGSELTGVSTKSTKMSVRLKLNKEEIANIDQYRRELGELSKNRDFGAYKTKFAELCKMLKVKPNYTLYFTNSNVINGIFVFHILENKYRKVEVKGKTLYHHRYDNDSIKALYPSAALYKNVSRGTGDQSGDLPDTLFPEPRVYCHISVPLDKASKEMGKQFNTMLRAMGAKGFLYTIKNPEQYTVYIDDEQPKTAAYIITDQDIPVEKISAEEMNEKIRNAK